jgi:hypothetical protein
MGRPPRHEGHLISETFAVANLMPTHWSLLSGVTKLAATRLPAPVTLSTMIRRVPWYELAHRHGSCQGNWTARRAQYDANIVVVASGDRGDPWGASFTFHAS